jgi:hypothetical protein
MKRFFLPLLFAALPLSAQVKITQGENKISVEIDGKPFTDFFYGPDVPHPYLHPLRAASGTIVTRHFPMEKVEGESVDHPHHRGLWFAHSNVNGFDFWNNEKGYTTPNRGSMVVKKVNKIESGKKAGLIDVTIDWLDPQGTPIMREDRRMTFYSGSPNRMMDLDFKLTAITPIKFGDNKDGVFAIRLAAGLEEGDKKSPPSPPRTGVMTAADGCKTEKECWGTKSNWMDYYGKIDGEPVGIAILDNPANPRHPAYWHARAYGLLASNIFGVHDFTKDKNADGSMQLPAGQSIDFKYRVIIHPGDVNTAKIAQEWDKYIASPMTKASAK